MKAVWTILGCCKDVAAAALTPFGACPVGVCAISWPCILLAPAAWSVSGLPCAGGPIEPGDGSGDGVISIGSAWLDSIALVVEGRIGIFLCPLLLRTSPGNGLRGMIMLCDGMEGFGRGGLWSPVGEGRVGPLGVISANIHQSAWMLA